MVIGEVSGEKKLGRHYIDFSSSVQAVKNGLYGPLDSAGVPMVDYDRIFRGRTTRFGIHYTPVTIAQYGLGLFELYLRTQESSHLRLFLAQADWLERNLVTTSGGLGLWLHGFPLPSYHLAPPWVSAMSQGQGMSVLLRAYQLTSEQRFLDSAFRAFEAFHHDLLEGGVCTRDEHGAVWFEEFPSSPASHVLNGFIFALWGLYDLYRATNNADALNYWNSGILTLRKNLYRYDWRSWSRYDLIRDEKAAWDYHQTHILQLTIMERLTGEKIFGEYAKRWQGRTSRSFRTFLSIERFVRGVLRRLRILPRAKVMGITIPAADMTAYAQTIPVYVEKEQQ